MPSHFTSQIKTLTHKNLLLFTRKRSNLITLLIIPLLISSTMYYMSHLIFVSSELSKNPDPEPVGLNSMQKCTKPANCTTVGYYVIGEKELWIDETMAILARRNGLGFGTDVRHLVTTRDPYDIVKYTNAHRNQTEVGIIFCTDSWDIKFNNYTLEIPCTLEKLTDKKLIFYSVYYNMTHGIEAPYFFKINATFPTNYHALRAKRAIDEALVLQFSNQTEFEFNVTMRPYPSPGNKVFMEFDFISSLGSFFLYMPIAFGFMLQITELLSEKSRGIKLYMTVSGLNPFVHIISWTIYNILISLYFAITTCIIAYIFNFTLFNNVPWTFWIVYLFLCGFSMNLLALAISSIAGADKTGYSISYAFLLFSFVFQVCTSNPNSVNGFYRHTLLPSVLRNIFEFYPGFNYIKIWADLIYFSGTYFDVMEGRYLHGKTFEWKYFFNDYEKNTIKGLLVFYSISHSFYFILRNIVLYYLITIYCEFTTESNQGVSKGPIHWFKTKIHDYQHRQALKRRYNQLGDEKDDSGVLDHQHKSAKEEEKLVDDIINNDSRRLYDSIILNGISKVYKRGLICPKVNHALKSVKFTINKGEIFTILGQNGAGKTTLMNILTGFLEPTDGDAYVLGHSIPNELSTIRKITSLCPQNDIYWDILTIEEHLRIFAIIKGFNDEQYLTTEINRLLELVGLSSKRSSEIRYLSGGMKRRLSIAISAIGDPKVIIFDEPTTGLDPIKKHAVLNLLKLLKQNRILILTTHSMEEADELSDRILFLKNGEVRCVGTSFMLKDEFSSGFSLSVIAKQADQCDIIVKAIYKEVQDVPQPIVFDRKIEFKFNQRAFGVAHQILKVLVDAHSKVADLVEDWSISQATLEDVFFNLHINQ